MIGLEKYCESDLINEQVLEIAISLIQNSLTYEKENPEYINNVVNVVANKAYTKHILIILKQAVKKFEADFERGKLTNEEHEHMIAQAKGFEKMMLKARQIALNKGLIKGKRPKIKVEEYEFTQEA